jgi:hypothetical protein
VILFVDVLRVDIADLLDKQLFSSTFLVAISLSHLVDDAFCPCSCEIVADHNIMPLPPSVQVLELDFVNGVATAVRVKAISQPSSIVVSGGVGCEASCSGACPLPPSSASVVSSCAATSVISDFESCAPLCACPLTARPAIGLR